MLYEFPLNVLMFVLGVFFLYKGSDVLIIGTSKTAARLGVSSLVISLTIIAYGTSVPELTASSIAAFQSHPSFSLGNIIGSCIANLLLVLGLSAVIRPLSVSRTIIKREMPILLAATILLIIFSKLNLFNVVGGIIFILIFLVYIVFFVESARRERNDSLSVIDLKNSGDLKKYILFIMIGLLSVVLGAKFLVDSSVFFARIFAIPEIVIAITLVAIGTSLPELAISAVAARKGESDISIGNIIGSNVFNILLVTGTCAIIIPLPVGSKFFISSIVLLIVTLILFPILYTGKKISRFEGIFLLVLYSLYMWYVFFL